MIFKAVIITLLVLIMLSLAMGLWYIWADRDNSTRAVRSLTWRVGLSVTLIILLFLGIWMGWIQPHGISGGDAIDEADGTPAATQPLPADVGE